VERKSGVDPHRLRRSRAGAGSGSLGSDSRCRLEGDRYALKQGTFYKPEPDFELTLIEAEAIEALRREYDIELAAGDARRNIVTRDVPLNHLVAGSS